MRQCVQTIMAPFNYQLLTAYTYSSDCDKGIARSRSLFFLYLILHLSLQNLRTCCPRIKSQDKQYLYFFFRYSASFLFLMFGGYLRLHRSEQNICFQCGITSWHVLQILKEGLGSFVAEVIRVFQCSLVNNCGFLAQDLCATTYRTVRHENPFRDDCSHADAHGY